MHENLLIPVYTVKCHTGIHSFDKCTWQDFSLWNYKFNLWKWNQENDLYPFALEILDDMKS